DGSDCGPSYLPQYPDQLIQRTIPFEYDNDLVLLGAVWGDPARHSINSCPAPGDGRLDMAFDQRITVHADEKARAKGHARHSSTSLKGGLAGRVPLPEPAHSRFESDYDPRPQASKTAAS